MRSAVRSVVLAMALLGCSPPPRDPYQDLGTYNDLPDCTERVLVGLQILVEDESSFLRGLIVSEFRHCAEARFERAARAKLRRILAIEPYRTRLVQLLVRDRALVLELLARVPIPAMRPYLGVTNQASLRAAVAMDDLEREPIPAPWRRFIDTIERSDLDFWTQLRLLEAFWDPALARVDAPSSPAVRRELMRALRRIESWHSSPTFLHKLERKEVHDPDPLVRREVVRMYGMHAAVYGGVLREAATTDPDLRVRATAFAALEDVRGVPIPDGYLRQR